MNGIDFNKIEHDLTQSPCRPLASCSSPVIRRTMSVGSLRVCTKGHIKLTNDVRLGDRSFGRHLLGLGPLRGRRERLGRCHVIPFIAEGSSLDRNPDPLGLLVA